jgi:hypothetical protein
MDHDQAATVIGAIAIVFVVLLILFPYFRIFQRTGHSGWWAILMVVPGINIIMLWVFAFVRWPAIDRQT